MVAVRRSDATEIELGPGHTRFVWRGQHVSTPLTGAVNVDNALLAAETALALEELELGPEEIALAMASINPVPGRLQVISSPADRGTTGAGGDVPGFTVLVDYAHTPAGLEAVLGEARALAHGGRVLSVFGCGGNRDRAKRPLMGDAAARLSDRAFLTSDNPRDEDPAVIIEEVLRGVPETMSQAHVVVEPERALAIRRAIDEAEPGDVVVLAGKGHETYQEIGGRQFPFDDAAEARQALASRFGSDPASWVHAHGASASGAQPQGA
jgi:UDP-N-acetylmuramyl-tripeptide synthetase